MNKKTIIVYHEESSMLSKPNASFWASYGHHDKICLEDVSYLVWLLRNVGCSKLASSIEEQGKILVKTRVQMDFL